MIKGLFFVLVSSILLFFLSSGNLQRIAAAHSQIEQHAKTAEDLIQKAFSSLGDAVFVVKPGKRTILRCNPAAEWMFGYRMEELIGRSTEMLYPSHADYTAFGRQSEPVLHRGETFHTECRMKRKDGTVFPTENTVTIIDDEKGWTKGVVSTVRDISERKQSEAKLMHSERQLRGLSSRLETLREEERTRISREIHDELGQSLTGLKMDLRWCERKLAGEPDRAQLNAVSDRLMAATQLADETIAAVQKIAAELRPGALDKLGLHAALRGEAARFEERSGIACRLNLTDGSDPASPEVATALFRILQESLTNVLRHANATEVEISLRKEEPNVYLRIQDNGRGIAPEVLDSERSLGLLGMSERVRSLSGRLAIQGEPGKGTIVDAQVPLHPASSVEKSS